MKKFLLVFIITNFMVVFSACASMSVNMKGKDYFIGKSSNDLFKYFGYDGVTIDTESEYDRVAFYTNWTYTVEMSKTTTTQYKTSNSENVFSLSFSEHNDGCLVYYRNGHNHYYESGSPDFSGPVAVFTFTHTNDNSLVRADINKFNNEIKRLNAVTKDNQQAAFDKTKIGSWFFLYSIDQKIGQRTYSIGTGNDVGIPPSESFPIYTYNIWQVNVVAENRSVTDKHVVVSYNERLDEFYNGNGEIITDDQAEMIIDDYLNNGFKSNAPSKGLSLYAYFKNDKVVKVESR